jgi:ATP adenylyltransferase
VEVIFSPGRYAYVTSAKDAGGECVLCRIRDAGDDEANLVLFRTEKNFVLINRYPYNNGHLMIVPHRHEAALTGLSATERTDLIELAARSEAILRSAYAAHGINLGMNLGESAGAGIVGHLHLHLVPRWTGDTNYMTVIGGTRVVPEEPATTYSRLRPMFLAGGGA